MLNNRVMFTVQVWSDLCAIQVSAKGHHFWSVSLQCVRVRVFHTVTADTQYL